MAPPSKRKRVERALSEDRPEMRTKLETISLRSLMQQSFDNEALELLDQLVTGATLPAVVNEEAARLWLTRLEDLLPQLREDRTLAQGFLSKVIADRIGNSTDELLPQELRETRDRYMRDRGVREVTATLADTPEFKHWLANREKEPPEEAEADDPASNSGNPESTSGSKPEEGTGQGPTANKNIDEPIHNYWYDFMHGRHPSPA